jgi:nicotinamidase-related amidase
MLVYPPNIPVASHAPLLYTPNFWDPRKAYAQYVPDLEGAYIEGVEYRRKHGLRTADKLRESGIDNNITIIDFEEDFRPQGRLPVMGMDDVVLRVCVRLINGTVTEYYTDVIWTQDGHPDNHISYASRWRKTDGSPFDLRTHKAAVLTLADEARGIFKATCFGPDGSPIDMGYIQSSFNIKDTVAYAKHLEATGQGPVWVFATHCKLGTNGVNLHPLLAETLSFMVGARLLTPLPLFKGHLIDSDWFGPFQPCRPDSSHPQGGFQKSVIDRLIGVSGSSEIAGIAEDFCKFHAVEQVITYLTGTPLYRKLVFLNDGTAPIVPNAPHVLEQNQRARDLGVRFINHDAPFQAAA